MSLTRRFIVRRTLCPLAIGVLGAAACTRVSMPAGGRDTDSVSVIDSAATTAELTRVAQTLLDALATGDTTVWARSLADNGLFTDENGATHTKRELIASIQPLPPGFTGHITVANPRFRVTGTADGSVAVMSYDALEEETVFGQTLHTRYHETDTYVRDGDRWRMLASQTQVLPSEHTAVAIDAGKLDVYAGTYQLSPDVQYIVTRDGKRLMGGRAGRSPEELFPLGGDRFFRRGAPRGVKIFVRDASGHVTSMIDRRDNNDLVWRRAR
jgi:hypothetical protein